MSGLYARHLPELVAEGRIDEAEVEAACRRVLRAKQRLGLFRQPYRGLEGRPQGVALTAESRRLACAPPAQPCVLLKTDGALPLTRARRTIPLTCTPAHHRPTNPRPRQAPAPASLRVPRLESRPPTTP